MKRPSAAAASKVAADEIFVWTKDALRAQSVKRLKGELGARCSGNKFVVADSAWRYHVHDAAKRGDVKYLQAFFSHPEHVGLMETCNKHFCRMVDTDAVQHAQIEVLRFLKQAGHKTLQKQQFEGADFGDNGSCLRYALISHPGAAPEKQIDVLEFLVQECGHGIDACNWGLRIRDACDGNNAYRLPLLERAIELCVVAGPEYADITRKEIADSESRIGTVFGASISKDTLERLKLLADKMETQKLRACIKM